MNQGCNIAFGVDVCLDVRSPFRYLYIKYLTRELGIVKKYVRLAESITNIKVEWTIKNTSNKVKHI